jgi:hypothetical protein
MITELSGLIPCIAIPDSIFNTLNASYANKALSSVIFIFHERITCIKTFLLSLPSASLSS